MNLRYILLFIFLYASNVFGQNTGISLINDPVIDSFPKITINLNLRDHQVFNKNDFRVKEMDSLLDFDWKHIDTKEFSSNKNILILVENLRQKPNNKFFKKTLTKALKEFVNPGDQVKIATFDRIKNDENQTLLNFLSDTYTDAISELEEDVMKIPDFPKKTPYNVSEKSGINVAASDLYFAIYKGLDKLVTDFDDNRLVLVLTTGFNNRYSSHSSSQTAMEFAKKNKIPVYAIQYKKQGFEHHKLTDLCQETYGAEFITNQTEEAASELINMMNNAVENSYGNDYVLSFITGNKPDGLLRNIEVSVANKSITIPYTAPKHSFFKMLWEKYRYWTLLGLVLLAGLIFLLLFSIIRNRGKQEEENALLKEEIDQAQYEMQQNKTTVLNHERTFKELKQQELQRINEEKRQKVEQTLLIKMRSKGSLPELHYSYNNASGVFNMIKPLINIGRAKTNDLVLDYPNVSREHAQLYFSGTDYYILDKKSTAGLLKNGVKITSETINHSDTFTIGGVLIYFKI